MDDTPLISLTMRGTVVAAGNTEAWATQRQIFRQQHCVLLPRLLDSSVIAYALPRLADERSRLYVYEDKPTGSAPGKDPEATAAATYARELRFGNEHPVNNLLHILLQQRPFLQAVDDICGFGGKLRHASGRYFEMHPGTDHFQTWHSDCVRERVLGIVINLSQRPFVGGRFQLRHTITKQVVATVAGQLGDCHLFRIHRRLEHRTTPLEGTVPRCVYAGWVHGEDALRARRADLGFRKGATSVC